MSKVIRECFVFPSLRSLTGPFTGLIYVFNPVVNAKLPSINLTIKTWCRKITKSSLPSIAVFLKYELIDKMKISSSTSTFQWIVAKRLRWKFRFFKIVKLCYASCEIEHNVIKHLYQCSATHSPVHWPTVSEAFKI